MEINCHFFKSWARRAGLLARHRTRQVEVSRLFSLNELVCPNRFSMGQKRVRLARFATPKHK